MRRNPDAEYGALMDELQRAIDEQDASDIHRDRIKALRARIEELLREQIAEPKGPSSPQMTRDEKTMALSETDKFRVQELHDERRAIQQQIQLVQPLQTMSRLQRQLEQTIARIQRIEAGLPEGNRKDLPV